MIWRKRSRRVKDASARIADQMDKDGAAFTHIHPKDIGGAILSLDRMVPKERWEWGGPHWQSHVCTDTSVKVAAAELQAKDPAQMAARWAQVLGRAATRGCREFGAFDWTMAKSASASSAMDAERAWRL